MIILGLPHLTAKMSVIGLILFLIPYMSLALGRWPFEILYNILSFSKNLTKLIFNLAELVDEL